MTERQSVSGPLLLESVSIVLVAKCYINSNDSSVVSIRIITTVVSSHVVLVLELHNIFQLGSNTV